MNKSVPIIAFLVVATITSLGQSTYRGLTPGTSTRADVDKVLGRPTSQHSEQLFEYNKGGKQIYIQYGMESPTAIRIQVIYSPSSKRSEILAREGLPMIADTRRTNKQGALEEYFANSKYIVLTYEENSQNKVSQVGYFSRPLFESVTPELTKNSTPSLQTAGSNAGNTNSSTPQQSEAEKPGTGPFLGNIPGVGGTVTGLKFFENDTDDLPAVGLRPYKESFARDTLKAIYFEFSVKYSVESATVFAMSSIWKKNGEVLTRQELSVLKPSGFNTSSKTYGFIPTAGRWDPGAYTLDIEVNGRNVAFALFTVK